MKTTLQIRLITLMVLSVIFLISAFTLIQINNQLHRVEEFNLYRARQGAFVLRDKLQEIFLSTPAEENQPQVMSKIKGIFSSLIESGAVETAVVLTREGKPSVLEGNLSLVFEEDRSLLNEISKIKDKARWLMPVIDKEHKLASLFVIVDNPYGLLFKLTFSLGNFQEALNQVYGPVVFTIIIVIITGIILGVMFSRILIMPVKILNQATKDIADGNLDLKVSINTGDELEELSDTFNYMTVELKKMKARAENANPLTKLPGNIIIQEETERRIKENKKFILIYADLDNFKAYNDKYGVHAGDKAIELTAEIIKEAIAKEGREDDFLGHEGGDDFLILTTPERSAKLCNYIIREFEKHIRALYSKEDLEKGYIEAQARDADEIKRYPIMTISLAGVSNTSRDIDSYAQITNIAAEVKKAVKKLKGSNFIADRRHKERGDGIGFRGQEVSGVDSRL